MIVVAKHLPVIKEFKQGTLVQSLSDGWVEKFNKDEMSMGACIPVELFFCSREVSVGDEVVFADKYPILTHKDIITKIEPIEKDHQPTIYHFKNYRSFAAKPYSVVAPVPDKANWVKENEYYEIKTQKMYTRYEPHKFMGIDVSLNCPTCGQLHSQMKNNPYEKTKEV
mgnify:FL=1